MPTTPPPKAFARPPKGSKRSVTFRLNDIEHAALLKLAESADMGHATLARRIVEHYVREHMPKKRK
jgi:hypothetical protein